MNRLLIMFLCSSLLSCGPSSTPKPKGELRLALPTHEYFIPEHSCPYSFEIPTYSYVVEKNSTDSSCWSDIEIPEVKATIHLTYRSLNSNLAKMLDESLGLTYEHHVMADNIENKQVMYPDRSVYGTVSYVFGNVASNVQFYVTDSTQHFLRGSLYFSVPPNKDSIAPVVAHLKVDIDHMLNSISWTE